jgi:hypothetical protein
MKTRQLIASTVLAISATVPAFALASGPTDHGDGTDHVALISQGKLATCVFWSKDTTDSGGKAPHILKQRLQ